MDSYRRVNTVKVTFDKSASRPTALDVHKWVSDTLKLTVDQVEALQLVGPENAVYLKLTSQTLFEKVLRQHEGSALTTFASGVQSTVTVSPAGFDSVNVRVFNLPLELPNDKLKQALMPYGTVHSITNESWSSGYEFRVQNGIRSVKMQVNKVIPSNIIVVGKRAYVQYFGQEPTCFVCGEPNHLKQDCPKKLTKLGTVPQQRKGLAFSDLFKKPSILPTEPIVVTPEHISPVTDMLSVADTPENKTPISVIDVQKDHDMDTSTGSVLQSAPWADEDPSAVKRQKISHKQLPPTANPVELIHTMPQHSLTIPSSEVLPIASEVSVPLSQTPEPAPAPPQLQSGLVVDISNTSLTTNELASTDSVALRVHDTLDHKDAAYVQSNTKKKYTPTTTPTSRYKSYAPGMSRPTDTTKDGASVGSLTSTAPEQNL